VEEKGKNATLEHFNLPPASNFWPKFPKKSENFQGKEHIISKKFFPRRLSAPLTLIHKQKKSSEIF
jgi:hypothetical protein